MPSAASALPALKPNHPNQSKPVPSKTYGILCGLKLSSFPLRFPTTIAATSAEKPEDM